jgi:hypothetical protein
MASLVRTFVASGAPMVQTAGVAGQTVPMARQSIDLPSSDGRNAAPRTMSTTCKAG